MAFQITVNTLNYVIILTFHFIQTFSRSGDTFCLWHFSVILG